jgi:hypothetical protein
VDFLCPHRGLQKYLKFIFSAGGRKGGGGASFASHLDTKENNASTGSMFSFSFFFFILFSIYIFLSLLKDRKSGISPSNCRRQKFLDSLLLTKPRLSGGLLFLIKPVQPPFQQTRSLIYIYFILTLYWRWPVFLLVKIPLWITIRFVLHCLDWRPKFQFTFPYFFFF